MTKQFDKTGFWKYGYSDFPYGHVDGRSSTDGVKLYRTDPFECLLGVLRMCGIQYCVHHVTLDNGRSYWNCHLSISDSPADFYDRGLMTARKPEGSEDGIYCIGHEDKLSALTKAISHVWSHVNDSCRHWRRLVRNSTEYSGWFVQDEPGESPPGPSKGETP